MNTPDSQEVIKRFFEAIYTLIERKEIRGKQTFTREHNIDRWNLNKLEQDKSRDIFQVAWLSYLVKEYHISPEWLLTGRGEMFKIPK
ncbi:MAG: hypothetical protein BHW64_04935 [Candidatus Melainabacteria bacterium LEY3_CP_29_8]|nr:MAG: hypothetical protein BHW64_04935 [Candidatus Melainabacteria bacterium LEY3_CP_29_8]